MLNDETIRLILEMTGSQSIEEVTRKLDDQRRKAGELAESYAVLEKKTGDYGVVEETVFKRTKEASEDKIRSLALMRQMLDETAVSTNNMTVSARGLGQTLDNNGAAGRGVLQASYAFQDFTSVLSGDGGVARAISSVQNNIPIMLSSLGIGAGLTGVISVATVGLGVFIDRMIKLKDETKDAAEQTERLLEAGKEIAKAKTTGQEDTESGVREYLKNAPGGAVELAIGASLAAEGDGLSPFRASRKRELERAAAVGDLTETEVIELRTLRDDQRTGQAQKAKEILGSLPTDRTSRQRVAEMARRRPREFPVGFADDIASFEPEVLAAADKEATQTEEFGQRAHDAAEKRKQTAKEYNRRRDRMERNLEARTASDVTDLDAMDRDNDRAFREGAESAAAEVRALEAEGREKARAAKEAARNNTAEARLRREADATEEAVTSEAMRQWNAGGRRETPQQIQAIIRQAIGGLPNFGGDVAQAVHETARQLAIKMQMDLRRNMTRMQVASEQYGY